MKLTKEKVPFTMVANEVLSSDKISLKAKGLYSYLFSKPDKWDYSADRIQKECKEERKAILRTLKELEEAGLLLRKKHPNGRVEYFVKYSLKIEEPKYHIGTETKCHGGEVVPISNKDKDSNTENTLSSPFGAEATSANINLFIDGFAAVNPSFTRLYKTQYKVAKRFIGQHGIKKALDIVGFLPKSNSAAYAPTITTPDQLERKLGELFAWSEKEKNKKITKGRGFVN